MKMKTEFKRRTDAVRYLKLKGWTMAHYHRSGSVTLSSPTNYTGYDVWKEAKGKWKITVAGEW